MTKLHTAEYRVLADELRRAREEARLSQYELADRLGVDQSWVSKYEGARRRLDVIEFLEIVAAIGCGPSKILERVGAQLPPSLARARAP